MRALHVGLIGFGAIARDVLDYLRAGHPDLRVTVLRRSASARIEGVEQTSDSAGLIAARPDLVIEAAGHSALMESAPALLEAGISVIAASVGSLVQDDGDGHIAAAWRRIEVRSGARLIIPPGAVGGLDYIGAVARLDDLSIIYTSRKPPQAWADELAARGLSARDLVGEYVLFEGSVADAAALYPRNLNVAATLALAAGDPARISVRVVVDSNAAGNTHEILCRSGAGLARFEFVNAPSAANPKTSAVTALSIAHCADEFFQATAPRRAG